jgi:hypothetical protein
VVSFLLVFSPKSCMHSSSLPGALHALHLAHNLLQTPVISSLLSPNILLSTLFSNTLSKYSSLNARGHVLNPSHILLELKMRTCTTCICTELLDIVNENAFNHPWQQAKPFPTLCIMYEDTRFFYLFIYSFINNPFPRASQ